MNAGSWGLVGGRDLGSLSRDAIPATVAGIDLPGLSNINPMLLRLAQRVEDVTLLGVMRTAREHGLEVTVCGREHGNELPRPDTPYSVLWFDGDLPAYGRIGVGMVGSSWGREGDVPVQVLTEESWVNSISEQTSNPWSSEGLMRWSPENGWLNDHVVFMAEPMPFRFLINWCTTGWRPDDSPQVVGCSRDDT